MCVLLLLCWYAMRCAQMVNRECKEGFRTGFVTIIGSPNVGKSTLMNSLIGDKLSIVTPKAQTTRHRIMGIVTGEDFQVLTINKLLLHVIYVLVVYQNFSA
jgi:ribosome biogenesis GTPase A